MSDALAAWWNFMHGLDDVAVLDMTWRGTRADGFTVGSQQPDACTWVTNNRWCHMCWLGQTVAVIVRLAERLPPGSVHVPDVATHSWRAVAGAGAQTGYTFIGRRYKGISWTAIRTVCAVAKSPNIVSTAPTRTTANPRDRVAWLDTTLRSLGCFAPHPPGSVGPLI